MNSRNNQKPFVLILGMHRSGTSFLTHALNLVGVNLGDLDSILSTKWNTRLSTKWNSWIDNPHGHWEHLDVNELADISLAYNEGTWFNPPKKIQVHEKIGKQISEIISQITNNNSLMDGVKNPRLILLFESWKKYLPSNLLIIGIFRHPLKVAESLKNRNNFSYEFSIELWKYYNKKLLKLLKENNGFLFNFDWSKNKIISEFEVLCSKLNLPYVNISDWYSEKLIRSDKSFKDYELSKDVLTIYEELKLYSMRNSGWTFHNSEILIEQFPLILSFYINELKKQGDYLGELIKQRSSEIENLQITLKNKEQELKEKELQFNGTISNLKNKISILTDTNAHYKRMLEDIHSSKVWKLLKKIDKFYFKI